MIAIDYNVTSESKKLPNALDFLEKPRYRWYSYKEGFSPDLVQLAIESTSTSKKDLIIDPFNGSGVVTLYASMNGYTAKGIEVNPFASFMAQTKQLNTKLSLFDKQYSLLLETIQKCKFVSSLINYSTFSEGKNKEKWLFNKGVLNSFESGWRMICANSNYNQILKLALIASALDNCNAVKDGKCLKYRVNWKEKGFNKDTFISSLKGRVKAIREDIINTKIQKQATIITGDSRILTKNSTSKKFKLCITSPPYLNSFDYTDVYRPELFLGEFIKSSDELYNQRKKTIRSHVEIKLEKPTDSDLGSIFHNTYAEICSHSQKMWSNQLPIMIHAYFEDMKLILNNLFKQGGQNSELWLVVSTSAYCGIEIPVDLIIGEIGARLGWFLDEIKVLRYINKRKSKNSPNISELRESLIIFKHNKKRGT